MPVVLADIGGLFAIAFLLISFVGWVVNLINAQNPPPAPNRGPQVRPQARDRKVQNEIERFLQEAMGNKKKPEPTDEISADEIEILEPAPRRRAPTQRSNRTPRNDASPQVEQPKPTARRERPGGGVSARHVGPSPSLGSGVTTHVQEHMQEHVGVESERHLPHAVAQGVSEHLGKFSAAEVDTRSSVRPHYRSRAGIADPAGLIADLRNPDGIRKAILLQEILAQPRALRK